MIPSITICGFAEVEAQVKQAQSHGHPFQSIVSIGDPEDDLPDPYETIPHRLRLEFADLEVPMGTAVLPTQKDVAQIIDFVTSVPRPLLLHCQAGISRSGAAGLITIVLDQNKQVEGALEKLLTIRPQAVPNLLMTDFADTLLGLQGRLIQKVEQLYLDQQVLTYWFDRNTLSLR
jgi:predicted protein tyrosine phosphatase